MSEASAARPAWPAPVVWTVAVVAALFMLTALAGGGMGYMWGVMWLWMLVPVALVALLVILLTRTEAMKP